MDIKEYLENRKSQVESSLFTSVQDESIPKALRDAMLYSLEAGGKRLRPILVIAGAEAVGGRAERVMPIAVALEMIHTFSLIHDDLPSMDDDGLRRGKPTNHKVFGEANAILAGDGLLAEAFYVLAGSDGSANSSQLVDVIRDIASATGGRGMTGGQVIDMESTGRKIDEGNLTRLHLYKTGALLKVSVTSGAKFCGAMSEELGQLERYGENIGLAFQIADDILDIEGDQELLGKDVGSDEGNLKSTYPAIIGLDSSKERAKSLIDDALSNLSTFGERAESLRFLAKYIVEREK